MSLQSSIEEAGIARVRRAEALARDLPARSSGPASSPAPSGSTRAEALRASTSIDAARSSTRAWLAWLDPRELAWRFGAILLFLGLWELSPRVGLISSAFVPPFSQAAGALARGLFAGELARHVLVSLGRSVTGFVLALSVALPLGFLLGWFRKFESYLDPLIQVFRQTSAFALFPLFILVLGVGEVSKIAIIFYGAQWYVLLNTISGVKDVDPLLIKLARSLRLSHFELFRKIILPAAFPTIFTGLRLSATLSILIIVSAEMMGASEGLGLVLITAQYNFDVLQMYAAIMLLALLGYATNYLLVALEKRLTGWKPEAARY